MLNSKKEGRFLLPGNDRRPADVFLLVAVVNPLQHTAAAAARKLLSPLVISSTTSLTKKCKEQLTNVRAGDFLHAPYPRISGWLAQNCGQGS